MSLSAAVFLSASPSISKTPPFPHISKTIWNVYNSIPFSQNPQLLVPFSKLTKAHCPKSSSESTGTNDNNDNIVTMNGISGSVNPDCSFSSDPLLHSSSGIKMPTAPWMKGPLLLEPNQVLDLSKPPNMKKRSGGKYRNPDRALTDKVSGARGRQAMKKIFKGIEKLKETQRLEETHKNPEKFEVEFSFGGLWGDKDSKIDSKWASEKDHKLVFEGTRTEKLEDIQRSSERIDFDFPLRELWENGDSKFSGKMPWDTEAKMVFPRPKKKKIATAAELTIDEVLLERLRGEAATMRKWIKVKKAGVTQAVVDQIRLIWKNNELAMLKFDLPLCRNMDRAREIVELKTGGLVVWTKKDAFVIYRGCSYPLGLKPFSKMPHGLGDGQEISISNVMDEENVASQVKSNSDELMGIKENIPINRSLYEREADRLLDGLGPRFVDWWYPKPLPVDADLLLEVIPGFKPPCRFWPPRARSKLTDYELTYLRKLARPLPTHFVLGRNRKLQGLAVAILKLWEKCHIAKIAVKWGIPNLNNEEMANELKSLTGGVLLLRNKFIIILYRGKDFLPREVANLVTQREMELSRCQLQEEAARLNAVASFYPTDEASLSTGMVGTLSEFQDIQSECGNLKFGYKEVEVQLKTEKEKLEKELRNQERKLFILKKKIERSAKELAKLNSAWRPAEPDLDQELLTEEERACLQKIGLKMDRSLLLGRRGVFDGVIEGLHQHWKHREVVKVITMQRLFSQVIYTAKLLVAESGGILVSVDKLKEGHAIIIYRGKNYRRPLKLVSQNLLNKKEALSRSLEMQKIGSLKFFAYQRQQTISDLKCKLAELQQMENVDE